MAEHGKAKPKWDRDKRTVVVVVERAGKAKRVNDRNLHPDVGSAVLEGLDPGVEPSADEIAERTIEVVYDWDGGQPKNVRLPGGLENVASTVSSSKPSDAAELEFLNPYGFVTAVPRTTDAMGEALDEAWWDRSPLPHSSAAEGTWTGRLSVTATALTPLLFIDDNDAEGEDLGRGKIHRTYGVRRSADGAPEMPITTIKGALRSAYEAITASRFGVWSREWDRPLAYREPAQAGIAVRPIRIDQVPTGPAGTAAATVFNGESSVIVSGKQEQVQAAAWLPAFPNAPGGSVLVHDGTPTVRAPVHGEELWAELRLIRHWAWNRRERRHVRPFFLWRVQRLATSADALDGANDAQVATRRQDGRSWYEAVQGVRVRRVRGFVVLTGQGILGKHDERFAFNGQKVELDRSVLDAYDDIMASYLAAHEQERSHRDPNTLGHHITDPTRRRAGEGLWAFARGNSRVTRIVPVHIGRAPWEISPRELAARDGLLPPTSLDELSAADRVFGWVAGQGGSDAHRGQLRIRSIVCASGTPPDQVEEHDPAIELAILGKPKTAQGRFYASRTDGTPHADGTQKEDLYRSDSRLRGRKFYWHHAGAPEGDEYWSLGHVDGTNGWFREYRSVTPKSDQNRSVRSWVKPGTTFRIEIDVVNLTDEELGALLWLCHAVEGASVRAGYGKPVGFGSLHLDLDPAATSLWKASGPADERSDGRDLVAARYRRLPSFSQEAATVSQEAATVTSIINELTKSFLKVAPARAVDQYKKVAKGKRTVRVHYPRVVVAGAQGPPGPDAGHPSYEWFVANERTGRNVDPPMSLPDVDEESPTLPYLEI